MISVTVLLNTTDNVKNFVNILGKYDYDVDLRSGRYVVDAKSILGIFSLDLNKPVVLEIFTEECEALLEDIKPFICD